MGWVHIGMSDIQSTVRAMCDVLWIVQIFVLEICAIILVVLSTGQTYTAVAYRGGVFGVFKAPPPKIPKTLQNLAELNPIRENC